MIDGIVMAYLKWHLEHEHAIEAGKIVFAFVTLGVAAYTVKPSVRSAELAECDSEGVS